jgi:hypothetical protein
MAIEAPPAAVIEGLDELPEPLVDLPVLRAASALSGFNHNILWLVPTGDAR